MRVIIYPHNYVELISAILCTCVFLYKPSVINRWFVWFLWVTVLVEFSAKFMLNMLDFKMVMYNLFTGIEFIFYAILIGRIAETPSLKKVVKTCLWVFIPFWLLNFLAIQGEFVYNTYTATLCGVLLCLLCLLYYYDILRADFTQKNRTPKLLIVSAIFLFYAGSVNMYASFNKLLIKAPAYLTKLYMLIVNNLNVVLYGLFVLALVLEVSKIDKPQNTITELDNES